MSENKRKDIHIISCHSNWPEKGVDRALKESVYNNPEAWRKFIRLLLISLGVGFTTAGILFFFAFNWNDLHKFTKLGIIEGLVILMVLIVVLAKINLTTKNIILTAASIIVGVLFAVFGQVYQTGANAYDFLLGWTLGITLWVLVANFAPLWVLFLTLINVTLILYAEQVAHGWSQVFVFTLLFCLNTVVLIFTLFGLKLIANMKAPSWFIKLASLASVGWATMGVSSGIIEGPQIPFWVLLLMTSALYIAGIKYGIKTRNNFYLAIIPLSCIIIISTLLIKVSSGAEMFLIVSLFIVASVTLVIKKLIDLQKQWRSE